jgi:putative intracellular protease/amidase
MSTDSAAAPTPSSRRLRRVGAAALGAGLSLVTLTALLLAGAVHSSADAPVAAENGGGGVSVPSSAGPLVVAVALGLSGTDAADALAPYEVFARSSEFSVYTVAATPAPVPLNGGLSVLPTYTFADAASGVAPTPDIVVVPAVDDPSGDVEAGLRDYVVDQYGDGAQLLGICAGARVLAATGVLDGHLATSHWSRIAQLAESNPEVNWVTGERYVQDGRITTSAGVTSGIPAALRLVQQLAGDAEAERIGREMAYPSWSLGGPTSIPVQRFQPTDVGVGLNVVLPWFRPTVGVALADGVGEVDAVAPFEVGSYSSAASVLPLGTGSRITTAHGLVLLTTPVSSAPSLQRLLVPASGDAADRASLARWAAGQHIPAAALRTPAGQGGFDAALADLAAQHGPGLADSTAKLIDYPARFGDHEELWVLPRTAVLLLLALALAAAVGLTPRWLRAGRRRSRAMRAATVRTAQPALADAAGARR